MTLSEYQIPKRADRGEIYANSEGIWWSAHLKRWIVTDSGLTASILRDPAFRGHSFDVGALEEHFGIDLQHLREVARLFPLAFEGERHRHLRKKFSIEITANTDEALQAFQHEIGSRADSLLVAGNRFCAMQDLLLPATRRAMLVMAGLGTRDFDGAEATYVLFDDMVSVRRRTAVNAAIGTFFDSLSPMPVDERYFRIALVVLGANTLLGSLGNSLAQTLSRNEGVRLADIKWDTDFCQTGLAVIEKVAGSETVLEGNVIRAGDRLRIILDAAGFNGGQGPTFSDLYFAVGPHKCPGMSISRLTWRLITTQMTGFPVNLELLGKKMREPDYVFNFPEQMEVLVHE